MFAPENCDPAKNACKLLVSYRVLDSDRDNVLIELQSSATDAVGPYNIAGSNSVFNALGLSNSGQMVSLIFTLYL